VLATDIGGAGGAAIALNESNHVVGFSGILVTDDSGAMTDYTWECHVVLWTWQRAWAQRSMFVALERVSGAFADRRVRRGGYQTGFRSSHPL